MSVSYSDVILPFFGKDSFLSNHHPSPISIGNEHFFCVEQYYKVCEARLFNDGDMAQAMMESSDAGHIKRMSRRIKNYNEDTWDQKKVEVMCEALSAKFTQNPNLCSQLIATGNKMLVEASQSDDFWGIGLSKTAMRRTLPLAWPGANMLGTLLMALRSRLRANERRLQRLAKLARVSAARRKARKQRSVKRLH